MQRKHRILIDLGRFLAAPLEDVGRAVQRSLFPLMEQGAKRRPYPPTA